MSFVDTFFPARFVHDLRCFVCVCVCVVCPSVCEDCLQRADVSKGEGTDVVGLGSLCLSWCAAAMVGRAHGGTTVASVASRRQPRHLTDLTRY